MKHVKSVEPKLTNLLDLQERFPDEQACLDYIENKRWSGKPVCPRCESESVGKFTTGKNAGKLWYCSDCKRQFTVKIGTIFEDSPIPLIKWFMAIWLCTAHKKGIASTQLAKDIGVTQKTAWHMLGRVRYMMSNGMTQKKLSGTVEVDETYIGGKEKNKHKDKKTEGNQGRSTKTKTAVFGMIERGGEVIAVPVDNVDKTTLQTHINDRVARGSTINTDEWTSYVGLSKHYTHEVVDHGAKEYARGMAHVNSMENFWSLFSRGIVGIYHSVSPAHLHRYCGEFAYRANTRKNSDGERFNLTLERVNGHLTYKELTGKEKKVKLTIVKPSKALNPAYRKQTITREKIDKFKTELRSAFKQVDPTQNEVYHKNLISTFLTEVYYKNTNLINVHDNEDLVIRLGNTPDKNIGVILEFKSPTAKAEMVSLDRPNVKALHELIFYYLKDALVNHDHKHLVVTNFFEWYIFDAVWFEKHIFRSSKLAKAFADHRVSGHGTAHFYEFIAKPFLDELGEDVPCVYFSFDNVKDAVFSDDKTKDSKLIELYKILSPAHLLKQPFENDSNTLDKNFYSELLYILGLEEVKVKSKRLIQRVAEERRNIGSLLENTIATLLQTDQFSNPNTVDFDKVYEIALELCITWLNRILFLKLLEGQLIKFNNGNKEKYSYLNTNRIKDYDELNELFFEALAVPINQRSPSVSKYFDGIPYLNSSLFESTELEQKYLRIHQLKDRFTIPVFKQTALQDDKGKRIVGEKTTIAYLFEFLSAYDFASDSSEDIQENNKRVINASVLGLIFEKINGYKDGSFFTPGYITQYMCHEAIPRAVVQRFNETLGTAYTSLDDIPPFISKEERHKANEIVNSLRICDPAVGSGHFLVSALNELIAIKSKLGILCYRDGIQMRDYTVTVANDELVVVHVETDDLFEYRMSQNGKPVTERQRVQEALFYEKQTLIENCLFGVDINPKSVLICRLRLWIELLKNSFYTLESGYQELETLPNIDINIKCGNSLISRFDLDADLKSALLKSKWNMTSYRIAVHSYLHAETKSMKREMQSLIEDIKSTFRTEISRHDPLVKKHDSKAEELYNLLNQHRMFELSPREKKELMKREELLGAEIRELARKVAERKENKIYDNAFEWRFEFPEVLDDDGNFVGFDVVIGNPPYGVSLKGDILNAINDRLSKVPDYEIYFYFMNLARQILRVNGFKTYIIPNTILFNVYARKYREELLHSWNVFEILDLTDVDVFAGLASVRCIITQFGKNKSSNIVLYRPTGNVNSFEQLVNRDKMSTTTDVLAINNNNWALVFKLSPDTLKLVYKIKSNSSTLGSLFKDISQGLIAYDKYRGQDEATISQRVYHSREPLNKFTNTAAKILLS